jgi:hypothetical protein
MLCLLYHIFNPTYLRESMSRESFDNIIKGYIHFELFKVFYCCLVAFIGWIHTNFKYRKIGLGGDLWRRVCT